MSTTRPYSPGDRGPEPSGASGAPDGGVAVPTATPESSGPSGGGGVALVGMQPVVARVFEITGADAVFAVHDTLEAALADDSA